MLRIPNFYFSEGPIVRGGAVLIKEGPTLQVLGKYMVVSLNYRSQNGGNVYRDPYYNGNPNIRPRIIGNLDQYPYD